MVGSTGVSPPPPALSCVSSSITHLSHARGSLVRGQQDGNTWPRLSMDTDAPSPGKPAPFLHSSVRPWRGGWGSSMWVQAPSTPISLCCCSSSAAGVFLPCLSSVNPALLQASPAQDPSVAPTALRDDLWALARSPSCSQTQARLRATGLNEPSADDLAGTEEAGHGREAPREGSPSQLPWSQ